MQPDGFCRHKESVHRFLLDLAVPRVRFLFRFRNAGTVLMTRAKHHRQVVGDLELRIFLKSERGTMARGTTADQVIKLAVTSLDSYMTEH